MKVIIEPIKLSKKEQEFLNYNVITFSGLQKIVNGEVDLFDMENLVTMQYLSQKKHFLEQQFEKLQETIKKYNEAIELAKYIDVKKNLEGEPLTYFEAELHRNY